jgi:hypothetical protein
MSFVIYKKKSGGVGLGPFSFAVSNVTGVVYQDMLEEFHMQHFGRWP